MNSEGVFSGRLLKNKKTVVLAIPLLLYADLVSTRKITTGSGKFSYKDRRLTVDHDDTQKIDRRSVMLFWRP